jgi:hypothetical protein
MSMSMTYQRNDGVGVAQIEGAGPVEPAPFHLEVAALLPRVPRQEHLQLRLQLQHVRFLHCEEHRAVSSSSSSVHIPSVVHAHPLLSHPQDGNACCIAQNTARVQARNTALNLFI